MCGNTIVSIFFFLFYEVRNTAAPFRNKEKKEKNKTGIAERYLDKVLLITASSSEESPITRPPHDHHRLPLQRSEDTNDKSTVPLFHTLPFQQVSRSRVNPSTRLGSKTNFSSFHRGKKEIFHQSTHLSIPHVNLSTRNKHTRPRVEESLQKRENRRRIAHEGMRQRQRLRGGRKPGISEWERRL